MLSLKNKVVMVTGGAGFVGSHLVDALVKERVSQVVVVDDMSLGSYDNLADTHFPGVVLYDAACGVADYNTTRDIMASRGVDVVFDLAVQPLPASLVHPRESFLNNINITSTMCELLCEEYYDTLIHFSSSEAYGTSQRVSMGEDHPLCPLTPYAASKAASDMLIQSYRETFGIDCAILRPFNIFGPRQNCGTYAAIIPVTIKRLLNCGRPVIYGNGEQTRDYSYVTDVVRAAIDMYKQPKTRGRVVNIGSGKETSTNEVIDAIIDAMCISVEIDWQDDRPGDVRRHIANTYLARDLIGYDPLVSFEDGIEKTVDWYTENARDKHD